MSNSSLISYKMISPNRNSPRNHKIDRITPHCVVGQLSAKAIGNCFISPSKKASCNYGIGSDGKVILIVDEKDRSWCSSSSVNDNRAVTIECASDKTAPYTMNDRYMRYWLSFVQIFVNEMTGNVYCGLAVKKKHLYISQNLMKWC